MSEQATPGRAETMEQGMARLLQIGVLLACSVVAAGGALLLWRDGRQMARYSQFQSEPGALREPTALLHAVMRGEPAALVQAGVLLLIATPVARVVYAAIAFLRQRDWMYVAVSLTVLGLLLVSLFRVR